VRAAALLGATSGAHMAAVAHAIPIGSAVLDRLCTYADSGTIILIERYPSQYPGLLRVYAYFPELLTHIPIHPQSEMALECMTTLHGCAFYATDKDLYISAAW
jgi:hypothetical protein